MTLYFKGSGVPQSSEGGFQVIVTRYGPIEKKTRFSGLPGGTVGESITIYYIICNIE